MNWPAVNSDIDQGLATLGLQLPANADGVISETGATMAVGSNMLTIGGGALTEADEGKTIIVQLAGAGQQFATADIINPGTNYRAGNTVLVGGAEIKVWTVTVVAATIVSGGSGGPPDASFRVQGTFRGQRPNRDKAILTATTDGTGVVTAVELYRSGIYDDSTFTGNDEPFVDLDGDAPDLTGLVVDLTLGVYQLTRKAAAFWGTIDGTTLTVSETPSYGSIQNGDQLSGFGIEPGTTLNYATGSGGTGTYTLSISHDIPSLLALVAETPTVTTTPPTGTISPTGGSGTGLQIQANWKGLPLRSTIVSVLAPDQAQLAHNAVSSVTSQGYCYGTDYGPAIQAALDAGKDVFLPYGVICHSTQLRYHAGGRLLGKGIGRGFAGTTTLAYIGPYTKTGAQVAGDMEEDGEQVYDAEVGEFLLDGNKLIGIAYRERSVQNSHMRRISTRRVLSAHVQLTTTDTLGNVRNHYEGFYIAGRDSADDEIGLYIGPGAPKSSVINERQGNWHDMCQSLIEYVMIHMEDTGFSTPFWGQNFDSMTFLYTFAWGSKTRPGIDLASDDDVKKFVRGVCFHFCEPGPGGMRVRGGKKYNSSVSVMCYNVLNGAASALVDGEVDPDESDEDENEGVAVEPGAQLFMIRNSGSIDWMRLRPYTLSTIPTPKNRLGAIFPLNNAGTMIPGAEITKTKANSYALAYIDADDKVRVLSAPPTVGVPTVISTCNFTASYGAGTNIPRGMATTGSLLYLVSSIAGGDVVVHVIDCANPRTPVEVSETMLVTGGFSATGDVVLSGGYLFIGVNNYGVAVADVTNDPYHPTLAASISIPSGGISGIAVVGNVLFLGATTTGILRSYDISVLPATPIQIGTLTLSSVTQINEILVRGEYAYLSESNATDTNLGFQIVDISNPASMTLVGSYDASRGVAGDYDVTGVTLRGAHAFLTVHDGTSGALHVVDVSNPAAPTIALNDGVPVVLTMPAPPSVVGAGRRGLLSGDFLYVTGQSTTHALMRFNISDPLTPVLDESTTLNGLGLGIQQRGNLLFIGLNRATDNLQIVQIPGTEGDSTRIGGLLAERARLNELDVDRDARVGGSLSLGGVGGLQSRGPVAGSAMITRTYTVATLPTGRRGMRTLVSDATAPAFLAAPVGGGAVRAPVFWDDSGAGAWKIG